jgi:hypothetical protein
MRLNCFKSGGPCRGEIRFKPKQVFAAYPFDRHYHWLFDEVVKPVVEGLRGLNGRYNLKLWDARAQTETRDFMCSIAEEIWSSRFGIVDLSKQNANVALELGLMLAHCQADSRRRFVIISSFEERLVADIASIQVVRYDWSDLDSFKQRLEAVCLDTFSGAAPSPPQPKAETVVTPLGGLSSAERVFPPLAPSPSLATYDFPVPGLAPEYSRTRLPDISGLSLYPPKDNSR